MKGKLYSLLKARFLVNEDAIKNWQFIVYLIFLAIIMIANTHSYEKKIFEIAELTNEVKELESTVAQKIEKKEIFPSSVPPKKIKVIKEKTAWDKLWQ
jgi:hypothetical protein